MGVLINCGGKHNTKLWEQSTRPAAGDPWQGEVGNCWIELITATTWRANKKKSLSIHSNNNPSSYSFPGHTRLHWLTWSCHCLHCQKNLM